MIANNKGNLGFVLPVAGLVAQPYLRQLYEGIAPIRRRMIAFWKMPRGWMQDDRNLSLLSSSSMTWKAVNKIWLAGRMAIDLFVHPGNCAPMAPLGWRKKLERAIYEHDIKALLIIYGGTGTTLLSMLERLDMPIGVLFCGSDTQVGDKFPWYGKKLRRLWQRADRCFFASRFLFEQALRRGLPEEKSRVMYLGTDIPDGVYAGNNHSDTRFICVASLLPVKGHEFLIKAFNLVRRKKRDVHLTVVGGGPLQQRLMDMTGRLGLKDAVEFTGYIDSEQVLGKLTHSDIYVQPSVRATDGQEEAISQSALEAQVIGLPAVVFNSGGLREAVEDGSTGIVVPERDIESMADAMLKLAEDKSLRNQMSQAARERIRLNFDAKKQNAAWREEIENLMNCRERI